MNPPTQPPIPWKDGIPPLLMGLIAVCAANIYLTGLTIPYNLLTSWQNFYVTVGNAVGRDEADMSRYLMTYAAQFALYILALLVVRRYHDKRVWWLAIGGVVACNLILLFHYPIDAVDIFEYVIHGRILAYHFLNPFYYAPSAVPSDPFYPYVVWRTSTTPYGPLWESIAAPLTLLAGDNVVTNVLAFKLVSVGGYAITTMLIGLILREQAPGKELFGMMLYAFNPLVLSSTAGNGHNDALMIAAVVVGFYFLSKGRYTLAALSVTAGALLKFIPALVFPVVVIAGLRAQPTWRERIRFLVVAGLACAALAALVTAPYYGGGDFPGAAYRQNLFTGSIAAVVRFYLRPILLDNTDTTIATAAVIITLLWVSWNTLRCWLDARPDAPARAAVSILMFFLLVTCLWFQPWYIVWVMALVPLAQSTTQTRGAILLSAAGFAQLPLFWLYLNRIEQPPPPPQNDVILFGATLGLCWLYWGAVGINETARIARRRPPVLDSPA